MCPRSSARTSPGATSLPRSRAASESAVVPDGNAIPARAGSPFAARRLAIVRNGRDEKSERQRSRDTASAGTPSNVGDSTDEPLPGVVALTRTTG